MLGKRLSLILYFSLCVGATSCGHQSGSGMSRLGSKEPDKTDQSTCRFSENCVADEERLEIYINASAVRPVRGSPRVDVGGYCNSANFDDNRLEYQVQGQTNTNWIPVQNQKCTGLGRFQIQITLPSNYNYNATHQLRVRILGLDAQGEVHENTRLQSHLKTIDMFAL